MTHQGQVSLVRKRAIGDAVMSLGAVGAIVCVLAALDERVREQLMLRINGDPSAQIATAGATMRSLTAVVVDAVKDQSIEHSPLVIFVLIAVVLFLFMLRT
jgi:hypothetical protein